MADRSTPILINRAPVLTLWAAVVARRLGYSEDEALTLGRALAGLNAQSKGRRLGIFEAREKPEKPKRKAKAEVEAVELMGRQIPVVHTPDGIRAAAGDKADSPDGVRRYLDGKFGERLPEAREAMEALAKSMPPKELADAAFGLYERFRPTVPEGTKGWGAKGVLDLEALRELLKRGERLVSGRVASSWESAGIAPGLLLGWGRLGRREGSWAIVAAGVRPEWGGGLCRCHL